MIKGHYSNLMIKIGSVTIFYAFMLGVYGLPLRRVECNDLLCRMGLQSEVYAVPSTLFSSLAPFLSHIRLSSTHDCKRSHYPFRGQHVLRVRAARRQQTASKVKYNESNFPGLVSQAKL